MKRLAILLTALLASHQAMAWGAVQGRYGGAAYRGPAGGAAVLYAVWGDGCARTVRWDRLSRWIRIRVSSLCPGCGCCCRGGGGWSGSGECCTTVLPTAVLCAAAVLSAALLINP